MSYSEPLINQLRVFFLSVGVGFTLCIVYITVHGLFRLLGKKRWVTYIADGLFCFITAFVSFFFMVLYNNGRVRLHLFLGEVVGFFSLYLSAGRYILALLVGLSTKINAVLLFLLRPFGICFRAVSVPIGKLIHKMKTGIHTLAVKKEK